MMNGLHLLITLGVLAGAVLLFAAVVALTAWIVKRVWQPGPATSATRRARPGVVQHSRVAAVIGILLFLVAIAVIVTTVATL
jgi:hypothetical protein